MTASETAAGGDAGSGARALDLVLLLAPLVLLAVFVRDLWYSAQAFSIERADNLDVVYPIFDRFFAELKGHRLALAIKEAPVARTPTAAPAPAGVAVPSR